MLAREMQNDWTALTRCKWRGHEVGPVVKTFARTGGNIRLETECVECGWPLLVWTDREDPGRYTVEE